MNSTCSCSCSPGACGCCEGVQKLTPVAAQNRPALEAIQFRVGTHGAFFETLQARLATMTVTPPAPDGGGEAATLQPLRALTTRDPADPAIALLDAWATVADVLTFYQERIANEGYLRTATERRSVLALGQLVGYQARQGVAASTYLAYTLDQNQNDPVTIPAGAAVQSIPGPDEKPQTFETAEPLDSRRGWNQLGPRQHKPFNLTLDDAYSVGMFTVVGANLNLRVGDLLLLDFGDGPGQIVERTVAGTTARFADNLTDIQLQPASASMARAMSAIAAFAGRLEPGELRTHLMEKVLAPARLGVTRTAADDWRTEFSMLARLDDSPGKTVAHDFRQQIEAIYSPPAPSEEPPGEQGTSPFLFARSLLENVNPQVANSLRLRRTLGQEFRPGTDNAPQLLINFVPRLADNYYRAWANAHLNPASPSLRQLQVMRVTASLFGAGSSPRVPIYDDKNRLRPVDEWTDWTMGQGQEDEYHLYLDQPHEGIAPNSRIVLRTSASETHGLFLYTVSDVQTLSRAAYGLNSKTTRLSLTKSWWADNGLTSGSILSVLRNTLVYAQSEPLTLADEVVSDPVKGSSIELDALYDGLTSGRWIIVSGERTDIAGVTGVQASELLMLAGVEQGFDPTLPNDQTHTTLHLTEPMAFAYRRDTLLVYGNVVRATHGETRHETLGAGDGSRSWQAFTLKQQPLTLVSAPTPSGTRSTLSVYVDDIQWREADTFVGLGSRDRQFVTKTDESGKTTLVFGNGVHGARLPTGQNNVRAVYRSGMGAPGNVRAGQLSLLQTRPLGVKAVINPLRASGGADPETRDQARANVPSGILSLDRLVSTADFADFARTFAGVAKADAQRGSDGRREVVLVTVAGADDAPVDPTSDLYRNLLEALRTYGDSDLPVLLAPRTLLTLVLSVNVRLKPDYLWEKVAVQIRANLLDALGFARRALGQPARLSEVYAVLQATPGVAYADVDAFGGVPETVDGKGQASVGKDAALITPDQLTAWVAKITAPAPSVSAASVFPRGGIQPAALTIFTPDVPATLVINQITQNVVTDPKPILK